MKDGIIAFLDSLSQVLGQVIYVRHKGVWSRWSQSPNESVSGAAARWSRMGAFTYPERVIDFLFRPFGKDHCERSFSADYYRALEYIRVADELGGPK